MSARYSATTLILVAIALAACAVPDGLSSTTVPTSSNETTTSTLPSAVSTTPPTVEQHAITDLSTRLGIESESIEVVKSEAKTWSDGSLGCPQPGMSYTQALVEGWQVLLQHGERVYDYHAGAGEPFLCASAEKDGGYDFVPPPGFDK